MLRPDTRSRTGLVRSRCLRLMSLGTCYGRTHAHARASSVPVAWLMSLGT